MAGNGVGAYVSVGGGGDAGGHLYAAAGRPAGAYTVVCIYRIFLALAAYIQRIDYSFKEVYKVGFCM